MQPKNKYFESFVEFFDYYAHADIGESMSRGRRTIDKISADDGATNPFNFTLDFEDFTGLNLYEYVCIVPQTNATRAAVRISQHFVIAFPDTETDVMGRTADWYKIEYGNPGHVDLVAETSRGRTAFEHILDRFETLSHSSENLRYLWSEYDVPNAVRLSGECYIQAVSNYKKSHNEVLHKIDAYNLCHAIDAQIRIGGYRRSILDHLADHQAWTVLDIPNMLEEAGRGDPYLLKSKTMYQNTVAHRRAREGFLPAGFNLWLYKNGEGEAVAKSFIDGLDMCVVKELPRGFPLDHIIDDREKITASQYLRMKGYEAEKGVAEVKILRRAV